jgi:hypothetical protein
MFRESANYAIKGSLERANAWYPLLGAAPVWAALSLLGAPLASPTDIGGGLLLLASCFVAAWIIFVVGRLIYWPWQQLKVLRRPSPLSLDFDPRNWRFSTLFQDEDSEPGCNYFVEVSNTGRETLENVCVTFSYENEKDHHDASGPNGFGLDPHQNDS